MKDATLIITPRAKAALRRAGLPVELLLDRHRAGDTGHGMGWNAARIQTRNQLDGLPWFSQWQLTRRTAVKFKTADGVTRVSVTTSGGCNCGEHDWNKMLATVK